MSSSFELAPASERTLDAGSYLLGCVALAAMVAPVAWAAWRARATLLPGWSGAPARLVEAVLALTALVWLSELIGSFGGFGLVGMVVAGFVLAGLTGLACFRADAGREPGPAATPPAPPASAIAAWIAAAACAAVVAAWMVPTLAALAGGMDRADSLWYHMPLAARWLQTGDLATIDHFDPIFFAAYYPANSEVFHAVGLVAFERDILSPLLNLGFLALGLLAAYCIGRPYGVGPVSLIGGAAALGAQHLVEFQAGEALNDIVGVAFVLAAAAVLVNARAGEGRSGLGPRGGTGTEGGGLGGVRRKTQVFVAKSAKPPFGGLIPVGIAGLAAGLAAGTKLSFLAPVVALFAGVVVIAGRGARVRAGAVFTLAALAGGGYWFARNLFAVGNPLPYTSFGPLNLPTPERGFELREGFSVFHYATDFDVWSDWFIPGLDESFGVLWPVTLAAIAGVGIYALWQGRDPLLRVLGAVVLFTLVAYVFTPLTAAGEEGEPIAFVWNVRYVAPAAAIALALAPCLPALRRSEASRRLTLAALVVICAATVASLVQWQQGHVKGAVASGIAVLAGFALWRALAGRNLVGPSAPRRWAAGLAAVVVVGAVGAGWWEQNHYLERRYQNLSPTLRIAEAARWGGDLRDARVAVAGVRGVFNQYPFYGADLSNHVQWLGVEGPDGAFLRIPTCEEWRQELADGEYTHVVTMYDPFRPGELTDTKEGLWTRSDAGAREIVSDGPVGVFELERPPDPSTCGDLPDLEPAELNGDSVNIEPNANQP